MVNNVYLLMLFNLELFFFSCTDYLLLVEQYFFVNYSLNIIVALV